MAEALDELVGEFLSLAERNAVADFGRPLPHDPSLPIPDAVVEEVLQILTESLQGVKQYTSVPSFDSFLSGYAALCSTAERFAVYRKNYACVQNRGMLTRLDIPQRILNAKQGEIRITTKQYQKQLSDTFAYHRRQIGKDTPLPLVRETRQQLDQLLAQHEQLKYIGAMVYLDLSDRHILNYQQHWQEIFALHTHEFFSIVNAYCSSQWERIEDLQHFRTKALELIPKYNPSGFAKLFSNDLFPEYIAEIELFSKELSFHIDHYTDIQRWAKRLRAGIAFSSCPDEFRQLRYLAPMLEEAKKRESAQPKPHVALPEQSDPFPSLPEPPTTIHPQLGTAYAYLTYPIGWMARLEKFANSLAKIPTETPIVEDLQYCISLRSYLQAVGRTPLFATTRNQFPTLEQNYLKGMAQLERLCML